MESYEEFSKVYDSFMDNIPYEAWTEYIIKIWNKYALKPELVLDLGCGTGSMCIELGKRGYDMIGVDVSEEMLSVAREKSQKEGLNILYLNQDMREFELYGTVGSVICLCDSLNYILEKDELLEVFKLVNNYLDPEGLFIFDVNTNYKLKTVLGNNSFCETREDMAFTCENTYDEESNINEYYTNFFIKNGNAYDRYEECHYERGYTVSEIRHLLEKAGLKVLEINDYMSFDKFKRNSEKIHFICQEVIKNG